jgi:manganese/iron transport system permease protein
MHDVINLLAEPLQYGFMLRGMAAAVLVGIVCAVIGTFVILRGMAFLGDALSHAILPGVAIGTLLGGGRPALFLWALGTALAASFGIGYIQRRARIKEDTAIGIVFSGLFALGVAILSAMRNTGADLTHILFGNVLAVGPGDLGLILACAALVLLALLLFYKELVVVTFDETFAVTLRLPAAFLSYLLLALVATTTVVSLQTVGVTLVLALLVAPAATGFLLARRLPAIMAAAAVCGVLSGVAGLYLSYYLGIASGAAIVLVSIALFAVTLVFAPRRGRRFFVKTPP